LNVVEGTFFLGLLPNQDNQPRVSKANYTVTASADKLPRLQQAVWLLYATAFITAMITTEASYSHSSSSSSTKKVELSSDYFL